MLSEKCELPALTPVPNTLADKGPPTWNMASSCCRGKESSRTLQTSTLELYGFLLTSLAEASHVTTPTYTVLFYAMPCSHKVAALLIISGLWNQLATGQ